MKHYDQYGHALHKDTRVALLATVCDLLPEGAVLVAIDSPTLNRPVKVALHGSCCALVVADPAPKGAIESHALGGELLAACEALADKVDATSECDHKRVACEDIGCIGAQVRRARVAIAAARKT